MQNAGVTLEMRVSWKVWTHVFTVGKGHHNKFNITRPAYSYTYTHIFITNSIMFQVSTAAAILMSSPHLHS